MADKFYRVATIADTETESDVIDISNYFLTHIKTPDSMTGTALTLKGGFADDDLATIKDIAGVDYTYTITSTGYVYVVDAVLTAGLRYISLVSGSAESGAKKIELFGYRI